VESGKLKVENRHKFCPISYNSIYEITRVIFIFNFHNRLQRTKYCKPDATDKSAIRNPKSEIACFGRAFHERGLKQLSGG
jgi:hypothetical protein